MRSLELASPKLRSGSCFCSFPEPRRCSEAALCAVISEGDVKGVRARMVGGGRRCGPGGHLRGPGEPPLQGLRSARGGPARPTTYGRCPYPRFDARCANARDEAGRVVSPGLAAAIAEVPQEVHTAGLPAGSRMAFWLVWTRLALPPGEAHGGILAAARLLFALAAAHAQARAAANRAARRSRLLGLSTLREPRLARLVA